MPRKAKELSARAVAALKQPGTYAVGGVDGLYLSVVTSGSRSWLFRYSSKSDGKVKRREMGLGGFPKLSLAEARDKARAAQTDLNAGRDPIDVRKSEKRAPTFWEVAEDVLATVEASGKNPKHRQQWRNTLKDYAAPLHAKPVDTVTTEDVAAVLAPIWQSKPETASRLRGRIERVLSVAKAKGLRSGENPAAWRENLEPILGRRRKLSRGHHQAIAHDQVPSFVAALRRSGGVAAQALEFTILTAARTGEVIGAQWSEFDLRGGIWTVPAGRMKAGREHRVPLSARAIAILEAASKLKRDDSNVVFPGQSAGGFLSNMAMAAVLKRMQRDDITVHGFRSSFRDWAGEISSFANEVCEMALAHAIRDKAEAAYRRGDLFEKRRTMMEAWAAYCEPAASEAGAPALPPLQDYLSAKRGRGRPRLLRGGGPAKIIAKRGRCWANKTEAAGMEHAVQIARQIALAGFGTANAIGVQALFEAKYGDAGREALAEAESDLMLEGGNFLPDTTIAASRQLTDAELALNQRGPDPDEEDDGQSYIWVSPIFETAAERNRLTKKGFVIAKSKNDAQLVSDSSDNADIDNRPVGHDVDTLATNIRRYRKKLRKDTNVQLELLGLTSKY
jgi:integrase